MIFPFDICNAFMKTRFLCILFALAGSTGWSDQVLLHDSFSGASDGAIISNYDLSGQEGTLAPLPYAISANSTGAAPIATIHNPNARNVVVRTRTLHADKAGVLAFGYDYSFMDHSSLIIEFEMRRNNAVWTSVVIGNDTPASQGGSDLFTLRLLNDGAIQFKTSGSGKEDPVIDFPASTANGNGSFTAFRIEVETDGWDGQGQATIRAFCNRQVHPGEDVTWQQFDLGGPNGTLVRPAFRHNYISFSSQHPGSNSTGFYRNIRISTKDRN